MWVWAQQEAGSFTSANAITGPSAIWQLAFSSAEADAATEVGTISWADLSGTEVTTYSYGTLDQSIASTAGATVDTGAYQFLVATDNIQARNNSSPPPTGYWKPTSANTVSSGDYTAGDL